MGLNKNIDSILRSIKPGVVVCAATKYVDYEDAISLLEHGIKDFAENRADSFEEKYDALNGYGIRWHFIGHLQSNKAKQIINKIDCLHSLDSLKLAKSIEENREKPLDCFVEVSINGEESKNGIRPEEATGFVKEVLKFKNIHFVGFMMMSEKHSSHESLMEQFGKLSILKRNVEKELNINIPYLSMGMSEDYREAMECGATHIRLGRILFDGFGF